MLNEEKTLVKISLMLALVGLGILMVFQRSQTSEMLPIDAINEEKLNMNVKVTGTISSVKEMPAVEIIKVKGNAATIDVVAFRSDTLELEKGDQIEIEGKVKKYKENLQIEAKKIHVL